MPDVRRDVLAALEQYERGDLSFDGLQALLQSRMPLVEGHDPALWDVLSYAESDLEGIRFGVAHAEQRTHALELTRRLRGELQP